MLKSGDTIYEYNSKGQIVDRHVIWKVTKEYVLLGSINPRTDERIKLFLPIREDGSLKRLQYGKRGRQPATYFVKSPQRDRDYLLWQLQNHIIYFVETTKNIKLLKNIYHEIKPYMATIPAETQASEEHN